MPNRESTPAATERAVRAENELGRYVLLAHALYRNEITWFDREQDDRWGTYVYGHFDLDECGYFVQVFKCPEQKDRITVHLVDDLAHSRNPRLRRVYEKLDRIRMRELLEQSA